jgi:hypothetical protein
MWRTNNASFLKIACLVVLRKNCHLSAMGFAHSYHYFAPMGFG